MSIVMHHTGSLIPEIHFTEAAIKHVVKCLNHHSEYKGIRLSVKKTGCSGFSYNVEYVSSPLADDLVLSLAESYPVYIDKASYPFLKKMNVDYIKQGLNYKFIFNNPNQTGQCGCGESFTVS